MGYIVPDLLGSVVATEPSGSTAVVLALRDDGYVRSAGKTQLAGAVRLDCA
jgi:hypothetical protein